MSHRMRLPLGLGLLLLAVAPVSGQVLPMPREEASGIDQARYLREVRADLEQQLQEWVNAWDRGDADAVSRFYVDGAVIVDPSGAVARGRPAVAEYWRAHRARASHLLVALTQVSATTDMASARGRISYRVPLDGGGHATRSGDLLLVFERQRGVWMKRVHAAVLDGAQSTPVANMRGVIGATGREPHVPAVPQIRWRAEPVAGVLRLHDSFDAGLTGLVGAGVGMEIGRVFELRASYAHGLGSGGFDALRSASAEVRFYALPDAVVRPYIAAGGAHVSGGPVGARLNGRQGANIPAPLFGGGLGIDLAPSWAVQVDARNILLLDPGSRPAHHWFTESRTSNWSLSGGISYTVGRAREWHDPQPTPRRLIYEGAVRNELASVLELWLDALERGRPAHLPSLYAADARLMLSDGRSIFGQPGIIDFWAGRDAARVGHLIFEDVRASGNVASVVALVVPPGSLRQAEDPAPIGALVTVFEQQRGDWVIKSQLLVEEAPVVTGP